MSGGKSVGPSNPAPRKPKVSRQQMLADLHKMLRSERKMSDKDKLRCDLTRLIDDCSCSYEVVIAALQYQIRWLEKARRDEHG